MQNPDTVETTHYAGMLIEIHQDIEGGEHANPRSNDGNLGILAFESGIHRNTGLGEQQLHSLDLDDLVLDCERCEGDGELAKNFGINSPGRPEIVECPDCGGRGGDGVRSASVKEYFAHEYGAVATLPIYYADYGSSGARIYESDNPNGVIFATRETVEMTGVEENRWLDALQAEIRILDIWLQGGVYGYVIREREGGKTLDSCWGFLADYGNMSDEGGWRYLLDTAREAASDVAEALAHSVRLSCVYTVEIMVPTEGPHEIVSPTEDEIAKAIYDGTEIDSLDAITVRQA